MCGLFAVANGNTDQIRTLAIMAGRRGPHACGWAMGDGSGFQIERRLGSLADHAGAIEPAPLVIGHSRLATSGGQSYRRLDDAQPLTLPGARAHTAGPVLAHNGVAKFQFEETLDTGCDSEILLRIAARSNIGEALARLPAREPYAVILGKGSVLNLAHRGLPLFAARGPGGSFSACSVPFRGAEAIPEETIVEVPMMEITKPMVSDAPAPSLNSACARQPIARVEWVDPGSLRANNYNPNHVPPIELELLKTSILEDGWTQPIVARMNGEIVDGFHRYLLALSDDQVNAMTGGVVPVVRLRDVDAAHQMMSTIRHNRARGTHAILRMADIVQALATEMAVPPAEICSKLGMEDEEVERLLDTAGMTKRGAVAAGFSNGWGV